MRFVQDRIGAFWARSGIKSRAAIAQTDRRASLPTGPPRVTRTDAKHIERNSPGNASPSPGSSFSIQPAAKNSPSARFTNSSRCLSACAFPRHQTVSLLAERVHSVPSRRRRVIVSSGASSASA